MINGKFTNKGGSCFILPGKPILISPNEMSPKSPTNKEEETQPETAKKVERPTSLAKRDMIVEISGNEKTKTRTAGEGKQDKPNMCQVQVQESMVKGTDYADHIRQHFTWKFFREGSGGS